MVLHRDRRRLVEQLVPEGAIITREWLLQQTSLDKHAIDNLVKSGLLELLGKGVYTRGIAHLSWQSIVHALQTIMNLDPVVGGLTALNLKGFSHYLLMSGEQTVYLYGNDNLPGWVNNTLEREPFVFQSRRKLFADMDRDTSDSYTNTFPWRQDMAELKISCPERAVLEMIQLVPSKVSFEHAGQLMEGMTSLSPRVLQKLLEACTNIKVKRLFLWMADQHRHAWFAKLNMDTIKLGSGNRVLMKNGKLDKTYKITVPKHTNI